ncbi:MAG: hypothetical protein KIT11_03130 [Fimbriimonadaceae bacterium]|nr:hypothetical protein [Fimbriimonadaceae bacterium]QYK57109.1 MAG: hypothetical protein KF733_06395 [Fimbriimonadaceae bacterium]
MVAQLRRHPELNIVQVCMATPEDARSFANKLRSPHRFICDPDAKLYERFGLKKAGTGQILNLRTVSRSLAEVGMGNLGGKPVGNPYQMPGVFVLASDGEVVWSYYSTDISDNPRVEEIRSALERAVGQDREVPAADRPCKA